MRDMFGNELWVGSYVVFADIDESTKQPAQWLVKVTEITEPNVLSGIVHNAEGEPYEIEMENSVQRVALIGDGDNLAWVCQYDEDEPKN